MKKIAAILLMIIATTTIYAQKKTFIRVFDPSGLLSHKGHLIGLSDSSLTIIKNDVETEIAVREISAVKLNKSSGNTILLTALAVGSASAILGAASADPDEFLGYTAGQGAVGGFAMGLLGGAAAGGIITAAKKKPLYPIKMSQENWILVKSELEKLLPKTMDK